MAASEAIRRHCGEIERCNQRGGRMLSIVGLIDAGTLDADLAAYALAAIGKGASFLVGAVPGGAGKTTVMAALLNLVPPTVELHAADSLATIERASTAGSLTKCCYICHEIGSGPYYAYLWGPALRAYFDLPASGHTLATNLHADTFEQAEAQIRGDNGVPQTALRRMNLMFFLAVRRSGTGLERRIVSVWESDGRRPHRRIFGEGEPVTASADARNALDGILTSGARTIEQVRARIVESAGGLCSDVAR